MFKWILGVIIIFGGLGYLLSIPSGYSSLSKHVALDGSIHSPDYVIKKWSNCSGTCRNYSSSTGGGGWK